MLKFLYTIFIVALYSISPTYAEDSITVDFVEVDSSEFTEEEYYTDEEYPTLLEQPQYNYLRDSIDGKELDSVTWTQLTKDLNYDDSLDTKEPQPKANNNTWRLPNIQFNSTLTKYVLFAIVIAALVFLMYRLISSSLFSSDTKVSKQQASFEMVHDDEQMMNKNLSNILDEAIRLQDFKTAIRILFIQSLQELQDDGWIVWKKEKTNRDYLNELMHREAFVPFSSMVMLYEKAWYSETIVHREDMEVFSAFKQQLRTK